MCRAAESGVDTRLVTRLRIDAQVGTVLLPNERSAQHQGILRSGDGGKHLVAYVDALGGIHRLRQRLGDDDSDRLADITRGVDGERRVWCDEERRAIAALQRHLMWVARHRAVRDRAQAVGGRIVAGQNREYAWRADRRCD